MKPIIFFGGMVCGAAYASLWWAILRWPMIENEHGGTQPTLLWIPAMFGTMFLIVGGVIVFIKEWRCP